MELLIINYTTHGHNEEIDSDNDVRMRVNTRTSSSITFMKPDGPEE